MFVRDESKSQRRSQQPVALTEDKPILRRCILAEPEGRPRMMFQVLPEIRRLAGRAKNHVSPAGLAATTPCSAPPAMLMCPLTQVTRDRGRRWLQLIIAVMYSNELLPHARGPGLAPLLNQAWFFRN